MNKNRTLYCFFYSHVWAIHMLKHVGLQNFDKSVVVELAEVSNLAPVFGVQGKPRYGLAGLLRLGARMEQLGQSFKYVPAPLLLAPHPTVPVAALNSAVSLAVHNPSEYEQVIVLVHLQDAAHFLDAYAYMDYFSVLWDIADPAGPGLTQLAQVLVENHLITQENWHGFRIYQHPNRNIPDIAERKQAFEQALQDYPLLVPSS